MWRHRLDTLARVIWWASITVLGFWVVPMLFATLPTPAVAGQMAARLFAQQSGVGLACALVLLLLHRPKVALQRTGVISSDLRVTVALALLGVFAIVVVQWGISPKIIARENLRFWHSLGSVFYLLQWLSASALLWRRLAPLGSSELRSGPKSQH